MDRLRPRNRPIFSGFTNSEIERMEKLLRESSKGQSFTLDFYQKLAKSFNLSSGRAGKPVIKWTEIHSWFQTRLQDSPKVPQNELVSPQCTEGENTRDSSELEFEARSSKDQAWYDVETFLAHRFLSTGEPEVRVRFVGFGAEEDEWVNIKNSVRERSVPFENTECSNLKVGDYVLCFQERRDQAIYYDAHIVEIQRRMHDIRGCRCHILIRYDHDNNEERVRLRRLCHRPRS
ncbi:putative Chromo domain, SAWADEE domain-containing protein [Medicago truncatula]|uniref:DNA-binding protein, putative n=1 Tax=Medicago truncatula TaxID=3880 RepID=A0A072V207_MEDTR|nr:protein SAWADEE HOMEODOMAIN HOMOLOG 1 [Medicago truncatula]KEH36079.1 DNA-binding protein, putative [Medicago truncatula]RHN70895.1 putative Chromo domain, SAWADEE domain-containing protein [Medicago truncatula]